MPTLVDFVHVVLQLLISRKLGISKIEFLKLSGIETVDI